MDDGNDTPVSFTLGGAQRIDRSVNGYEHYIIGRPTPRKQQGPLVDDAASDAGGGGSSGCCCNSANCVDLCESIDSDVILGCTECPDGAIRNYKFSIGDSVAFTELSDPPVGFFTLTWVSGCVWESDTFDVGSGTYKLVLDVSGVSKTVVVEHVSGTDPLKITDGYHRIRWTFSGSDYACLCNMQFSLGSGRVYKPKGLNGLVCLIPLEVGALPQSCPQVLNPETDAEVIPCLEFFTFPELDLSGVCDFTDSTAVPIQLAYIIDPDRQCAKAGTVVLVPESSPGALDETSVTADIWYAGETATLTLRCGGTSISVEYTSAGEWVIGENVLTIVTPTAPFPTNITVTLTDCHFSSSHPDYGYGCGGSSGNTGCATDSCFWVTLNAGDESTGPGPYHWVRSGGVGAGCANCDGCPEPDTTATEGATATTFCLGT